MFCFDQVTYDGKTLLQHAQQLNDFLEKRNGWAPKQWPPETCLRPGKWGTDVNVCRIGVAINTCCREFDIDSIAAAIHVGWCICYNFWLENEPWNWSSVDNEYMYDQPYKQLIDKYNRANTRFSELDEYTKNILIQMAEYVKLHCLEPDVSYKLKCSNKKWEDLVLCTQYYISNDLISRITARSNQNC